MDTQLPLIFRVLQILIPTFAVIILCTGVCRCFLRNQRRRHEQRQLAEASARAVEPPSSVYIIPCSPREEQQRGTPCYSQEYAPPPPYSEMMKPNYPQDPPPSYTESVSPAFSSNPSWVAPSAPAPPQ